MAQTSWAVSPASLVLLIAGGGARASAVRCVQRIQVDFTFDQNLKQENNFVVMVFAIQPDREKSALHRAGSVPWFPLNLDRDSDPYRGSLQPRCPQQPRLTSTTKIYGYHRHHQIEGIQPRGTPTCKGDSAGLPVSMPTTTLLALNARSVCQTFQEP
ncbi:hypothetical protein BKA56DRAFT_688295 [Ilyonectria sp. MPI-CAGE-AT-0026]|nr:hypothetical protein BKA56DRAFT_688295 [Ilyonectria sp. MPI-CAGE-AT-0026]